MWLSSWAESPKKDVTGTALSACVWARVPGMRVWEPPAACFPGMGGRPLSARRLSSGPPPALPCPALSWLCELNLPERCAATSRGARHAESPRVMARRPSSCMMAQLAIPVRWAGQRQSVSLRQRAEVSHPPGLVSRGPHWGAACSRAGNPVTDVAASVPRSCLCPSGLAGLWAAWSAMGLRDSGLCPVSGQS